MSRRHLAINLVHGLPDDQHVYAATDSLGAFLVTRLGTPSFLDQIESDWQLVDVWLGPGAPQQVKFRPGPTINYIADADLCRAALQAAVTLSEAVAVPWFNHPRSVLNNTRDQVAQRLQGIPGVVVPQTIRLAAPALRDIADAIAAHGLQYPVILRIAGHHGGRDTIRVMNPDELDTLDSIPWGGQDLYVTEFVECRSRDRNYRKHRIVMIGGEPFLRHVAIGTHWLSNKKYRLINAETLLEERNALDDFSEKPPNGLMASLKEIHRRLALDYVGIDCCLRDDDTLVLFEANPAMRTMYNPFPAPNMWDAPIERIKRALLGLLAEPARWFCTAAV